MARDLRFLTAAIKINSDLERMGDLAVNIVERALSLISSPGQAAHRHPAHGAAGGVHGAQEPGCFRQARRRFGAQVLLSDDAVDDLRDAIYEELVSFMQHDPSTISRALDLILVARNLERIADHATNIAEDVLFLVQGVDVRHHAEAPCS